MTLACLCVCASWCRARRAKRRRLMDGVASIEGGGVGGDGDGVSLSRRDVPVSVVDGGAGGGVAGGAVMVAGHVDGEQQGAGVGAAVRQWREGDIVVGCRDAFSHSDPSESESDSEYVDVATLSQETEPGHASKRVRE